MNDRIHEPSLHATPVLDLRPTQMTLGMGEVARKRSAWKMQGGKTLSEFLGHHMVPVVVGPGGRRFLIDHHHLARALHDEGVDNVFVTIVADFHKLDADAFWNIMDFHGWTHPFDGKGRRRPYADLPKTVAAMEDDPYRSLAGELRYCGGFAKDSTPFSEFVWADFLRRRIKPKDVRKDFGAAIETALGLTKSDEASYLPGWCAPHGVKAAAKPSKTGKPGREPGKRAKPAAAKPAI